MTCIHMTVILNEDGEKQCHHCGEVKQLRIDPAQAWSTEWKQQQEQARQQEILNIVAGGVS